MKVLPPRWFCVGLLFVATFLAGYGAAYGSQSGAPHYPTLFAKVAIMLLVCIFCTAAYFITVRGWTRWLLVTLAALATLGTCEFAVRLFCVPFFYSIGIVPAP
jgi:hypothetical protein